MKEVTFDLLSESMKACMEWRGKGKTFQVGEIV